MKMEAVSSSKTLVPTYQILTLCCTSEEHNIRNFMLLSKHESNTVNHSISNHCTISRVCLIPSDSSGNDTCFYVFASMLSKMIMNCHK
jgi:hypothetical protein